MKHFYQKINIFLLIAVCLSCEEKTTEISSSSKKPQQPLFALLSPQQTGVYFQNTLTEGLNTNVLMYEYFYNGGGVATDDFNGDGLIDIYFTSNMADNKLYLNRESMQFEDVTVVSGATGRPGPWKTGVTQVDINGDNKLDLYISYSGALPEAKRKNQLYINQGNNEKGIPVFKEESEKYGLASAAFSNQAYFFDYDRDGDLDALLLNHNPKSIPILNEVKVNEFLKKEDPFIGVRLFEQVNGSFKDVTPESGISSSALTYGLSIAISDIDNDGWPDFYICNDYTVPDYLYINNHNGTFTDKIKESLNHNSLTSMGNDIADINNDGHMDIVSMDMLPEGNKRQKLLMSANNYEKYDLNVRSGFHHQFMRNMLQINNGNGTFSEVGQLSGVSNTDWSWAVLLADYNNDGWRDMYVTNGYYRDYTNMDFIHYMNNYVSKKGRMEREDVLELTRKMPSSNVVNYMFENVDGQIFANASHSWGVDQPSNSNGAAYADLDNDGDLDLVVNNINQSAFIYENLADKVAKNNYLKVKLNGEGLNTQGLGAKVMVYSDGKMQCHEQAVGRGYLSGVSSLINFGLGTATKADSLTVIWPDGKMQTIDEVAVNQLIVLNSKNASEPAASQEEKKANSLFSEIPSLIAYQNPKVVERDFDRQRLLLCELSFEGPCMAKADVNEDGVEDVFIGGARGQSAALYLGRADGTFRLQQDKMFEEDKQSEDVSAAFFDANNDGHSDLYVAGGGYHNFEQEDPLLQDRLYINDGKGNFTKSKNALPEMLTSKGCVAVTDLNGDGFQDLFVGGRVIPGRYPEPPQSYLLINDGTGKFKDQTQSIAPELQNFGMITDAVWVDMNRDGRKDLVVVGEWLPVTVFVNQNGKLENKTLDYFNKEYRGWWNTIEVADFNHDQQPDLLAGNIGTNTQFRASDEEPAELYYSDFDANGAVDPIFCYYIEGESFPYLSRDELTKQIPSLRQQFNDYESYAEAKLGNIFNERQLGSAQHLKANHMETTLFLSQSEGKFKMAALPLQTQYAPVYTITILDYNGDENEDVLLCGNNSHLMLKLGGIDANYGVLLQGDGKGGFRYIDQMTSGFKLRGDVRSCLKTGNNLLLGVNQARLVVYKLNEQLF